MEGPLQLPQAAPYHRVEKSWRHNGVQRSGGGEGTAPEGSICSGVVRAGAGSRTSMLWALTYALEDPSSDV